MFLRKLYSIIRNHWWITNSIISVLFIIFVLVLENYNIDSYWATTILLPLFFTMGVNVDMKITYKEGIKILSILLILLYGFIIWSAYSENQSLLDVFSIGNLKNIGYVTILPAIGLFLFGIIPVYILHKKDSLFPRNTWKKIDANECAYFVYRKLSNETADRTSLGEIEILLEVHNPVKQTNENKHYVIDFYKERLSGESNINSEDLKEILSLRDKYKKDSGIKILN